MISQDGITLEKSLRLGFLATNNEAKNEALLARLTAVQKLGGKTLKAYYDSRLVVGQVQGEYEAKDPRMLWYLNQVKLLSRYFYSFTLEARTTMLIRLQLWLRLVGKTYLESYSLRVMCCLLMISRLQ